MEVFKPLNLVPYVKVDAEKLLLKNSVGSHFSINIMNLVLLGFMKIFGYHANLVMKKEKHIF